MKVVSLFQALRDPRCYPFPVRAVETIETHISWVFLAGDYAYKVKKPVDLGFCDFTTLARRRFFCQEELRLNARVAPQLYLGVVPIVESAGGPRLEGEGEAVEFAVKMRRFAQEMLLDALAASGRLEVATIDRLAQVVARMHATAAHGDPDRGWGSPEEALRLAVDNFAVLEGADLPRAAPLARLREWTHLEFQDAREAMKQRELGGFVRECHGDLHLGNIVLADGVPLPFDCVEFDPRLRWTDVMSDLGFLVMDLEAHGLDRLAARLLTQYLEESGDYEGLRVLRFYRVYRALVRAKIEHLRSVQRTAGREGARACEYIDLASRTAIAPRPFLEITSGVSGSGKSTAALGRVEESHAVRIRSDVERKRLHGIDPREHRPAGVREGIYTSAGSDRVYERLAALARGAIRSGYPVIVDAAFLERPRRDRFRELARQCGVPFRIVSCEASEATLLRRVSERWSAGTDASDARGEVLRDQLATRDAIGPDEGEVVRVRTDGA
ncbi:MAG TPA: AAA family ATPase [Usitatibacter sp.]|nr:AAA family ATPase [Usitatibacter sp.]